MKDITKVLFIIILTILTNGCNSDNNLCQSPSSTLQNSTVKNGIKLDIEIIRCSNENQPIKIKSVVTNENNYSVVYRMSNIGDPAIYNFVSNSFFSTRSPTNPNDPKEVSPAINYDTLEAKKSITRETTWNNKLSVGLLAPNGDYNISVHFTQVADKIYDNNVTHISTGIMIKKQHSENFITPKNAINSILKDEEVSTWLDAHEGILCKNNEKYSLLKYENAKWISATKDDSYYDQSTTGKECGISLKNNKTYHFYAVDKFYLPIEITKNINAIK